MNVIKWKIKISDTGIQKQKLEVENENIVPSVSVLIIQKILINSFKYM